MLLEKDTLLYLTIGVIIFIIIYILICKKICRSGMTGVNKSATTNKLEGLTFENVKCGMSNGSSGSSETSSSCGMSGMTANSSTEGSCSMNKPVGEGLSGLTFENKECCPSAKNNPLNLRIIAPEGLILRCEATGKVFKIENGRKRRYTCSEIFKMHHGENHVWKDISCPEINKIYDGPDMLPPEGSFIRDIGKNIIYRIVNQQKRPLSQQILRENGIPKYVDIESAVVDSITLGPVM
jgi:hypothetical protein